MNPNYNALILKSVKITAGAILAILFASFLNLKYGATAGIITILSIQNTKKETIQTALARGEAFCCALLVSFLCYNFFGYTTAAFGIYLLIFTTLCLAMKWSSAIAMDSVLITHFLAEKTINIPIIANEISLFLVRAGIGVILNLSLRPRKMHGKIKWQRQMSPFLRHYPKNGRTHQTLDRTNYDGSCFLLLDKQLGNAKSLALTNMDNTLDTAWC